MTWLLSEEYASQRRAGIHMDRASSSAAGVPPWLESANNADGNVACLTQTLNQAFGSMMMAPDTDMLLNNCMALFDPHPGQPNSA